MLVACYCVSALPQGVQGVGFLMAVVGIPLLWVGGIFWYSHRQAQANETISRTLTINNVDAMDGLEFERYVSRILKSRGFITQVTPATGDLGVDIIATRGGVRYAIQVKRYQKAVSRRAVSDAVAAKDYYHCSGAMVITNSYFSSGAIELAKSAHCELVDRHIFAKWVNEYSQQKQNE